jgi:hypothetical protein
MRLHHLAIALLTSAAAPACAQAEFVGAATGKCAQESSFSDAPYRCNFALIQAGSEYPGQTMISFATKASPKDAMLSFAGQMQSDGVTVIVNHFYSVVGAPPRPISEGVCQFQYNDVSPTAKLNHTLTDITCGAWSNEAGRGPPIAYVVFRADPRP